MSLSMLIPWYTELEPARLFNNQSVYENWALVRGLELIEQAEFYRELPKHRRLSFKDAIITAVLATDMAKHFEAVIAAYQVRSSSKGDPKAWSIFANPRAGQLALGGHR
jgi:hypothetical protein